ncbi:MAG TPA: hypothetical protein VFE78_25650, partial [Gemmataceae bacterium]|nr:hypothetical protein [Gemmataceae bacterium]
IEALLLTFFQRRFRGMAVPADAEDEGPQPQQAEGDDHASRQVRRKVPLFKQTLALFASFREAARALPALVVRGQVDQTGALVGNVLEALEESIRGWANLRLLSDCVRMPRRVAPLAIPAAVVLHPLPDLSQLHCLEEVERRQGLPVPTLRVVATYCQHHLGPTLILSSGRKYPDGGTGADVCLHAPGRGACLPASCVPVSQFLHPEDPASIVAAFLASQAGRETQDILEMLQTFDVAQQVREAAADVPRLDLLHVKRAARGRICFWRKRLEHFVCLVMRRQDAVRLGILRRVRALPPREQALLREHFRFCPEQPVALRIECTDGRDGGGGEGPPPPPPPAPEQREEHEDAPPSVKVGVG